MDNDSRVIGFKDIPGANPHILKALSAIHQNFCLIYKEIDKCKPKQTRSKKVEL